MKRRETKQLANDFLKRATDDLATLPYAALAEWPEWPKEPHINLHIPSALAKYTFTVMKDAQEDGSVRVCIQRYKPYFLGVGEMTADGIFIYANGDLRCFTQEDIWDVT